VCFNKTVRLKGVNIHSEVKPNCMKLVAAVGSLSCNFKEEHTTIRNHNSCIPKENAKTFSSQTKQGTRRRKNAPLDVTERQRMLIYEKLLKSVKSLWLTVMPSFYGNGHDILAAEEVLKVIEDFTETAD